MRIDVAHIDASHEHAARGRVPEARDERGARGLPAARGADERKRAPGGDVKAHMVDGGGLSPLVREAHVLEAHAVSRRALGRGRHGKGLGPHDAPDAGQRVSAHLRRLAHEHELGHRGGHHGREDRVEREVGYKAGKIRLPGSKQKGHGQEERHKAVQGREVHDLGTAAKRAGIVLRHMRVVDDGFVERLERVNRLLEDLDHGDAAHVLGARLVHAHERTHIGLHELAALTAHHGCHGGEGYNHGDETRRAQTPIEGTKKHEQTHDHGHGARDVGQHVCEQGLGRGGAPVHDAAELARGVGVEVAERQFEQVIARSFADVGRAAERRQVRAHETSEVDNYARQRESHGPPAVGRNAHGRVPIRGHGNEVSRHEPDAHVGPEAQELRRRRQPHPEVREPFAVTGVREQLADASALLLLLSHAYPF